jgi:hypothetical protein
MEGKFSFLAEINFFINKRKVKKLSCASASGDENFFFMFIIIIDDLSSISANDVK